MQRSGLIRFAGLRLDPGQAELRDADGNLVPLRPKTRALLEYLVSQAGRVAGRQAILDAVWPDVTVGDESLSQAVAELRRALGPHGAKLIRTVPRVGYTLELDHEAGLENGLAAGAGRLAQRPVLAILRPSLAVLPFVSLGGDPEQEYFADGMVDDLITALSRIRWFFVIARNSAFTYRGRAVPAPQVGRELGVRYVVEGAIRRAAGRVRVNVEVVEAESGISVWANRFDGADGDVFALQDRIVASIVGAVEPSLRRAELERVRRRRPTEQPDAYEAYWRASAALRPMTAANCAVALGFLDQALAADPGFPLALAAAACCRGWRVSQAFEPSGDAGDAAQAIALAEAAVAAGPDDPTVLAQVGLVFAFLGHRRLAALTFAERAVELHPNSALVRSAAGWVRLYQGDAEAALGHFAEAVRFDPLDPAVGEPLAGAAFAHLLADRVEEAVAWAERAVAANPDLASAQRALAAALGTAARPEAAEAAARLLAGRPGFNLADYAHARTAHPTLLRVVSDGLRRAGIPECGPGFPP